MNLVLCLLTLNEIECLELIFDQIPEPGEQSGYDSVVAIDGGSTDGTVDFLERKGIAVLKQTRKGRGEAFRLAFNSIDADAYLFFSPDGNEAIKDLGKFRQLLNQGADLVIASRMMKGAWNEEDGTVFRWRKWANLAFNRMANLAFNRRGNFVTDSINGYRAITRGAANTLALTAADYTIEYQMTIRAMKHELNIAEFPTHEGQRLAGATGAPSLPTGLRFMRCLMAEMV